MFLREQNEAREHRDLAVYALKSSDSKGRAYPQTEDKIRPCYLRDRDRVIFSAAFRRLEYKTQVFIQNKGDYYRTRLTHTLEVAQIARSVAYSLCLNEGFVEALALAHDLGHPPFGHAGEEILNDLMSDFEGFEHNIQGLRIVDLLENRYPNFRGLNLTNELRASILKHGAEGAPENLKSQLTPAQPFLEAQVVDLADRVAYTHHDIDDGLKAGILTEDVLKTTTLWREASCEVDNKYPDLKDRIRFYQITGTIVKRIIGNMSSHSHDLLNEAAPKNSDEARKHKDKLIKLSPELENVCQEMNDLLYKHFYQNYRVARTVVRSEKILNNLFNGYLRRPEILPPDFIEWGGQVGIQRAICDYISGMTDRYAEDEWRRLLF